VAAIYDGVGRATWEANFDLLARKATLVTCQSLSPPFPPTSTRTLPNTPFDPVSIVGNASGAPPEFSPLKLVKGNWKVTRPTLNNFIVTDAEFQSYTTELFELLKSGALKLLISHTSEFSAEGLREAHELLTGRKTVGKLVVEVAKE
jgi:NADPH2:quinone reductase